MLLRPLALGIAVFLSLPWSSAFAEDTVWSIRASASEKEPSIFLIGPDVASSKQLVSSSPIIQNALVTALLSFAPVTVRLKEGSNEEIERVEAFGVGGTRHQKRGRESFLTGTFRGAWRESGLSGSFGLFGLSRSANKID